MILSYKVNMAGDYHMENGLPCQDAYAISEGADGVVVAACADGLGSARHSDVGALVAVHEAVNYCARLVSKDMTPEAHAKVMNNAFVYAYKAVLERAKKEGIYDEEYDTTLCLVVYDGEHLHYGQSGDSGLVVLFENGEYERVTVQQRDEDGCVFPLCWGPEKWVFGSVEGTVSSVMIMTDGVFEQICPPIMRGKPIDINIPLARKFLNRFDVSEKEIPLLEEAAHTYLENYPPHLLNDDKTVVVLWNPQRKPKEKDASYYAAPDWKTLHEEAKERLNGLAGAEAVMESLEKADSTGNEESPDGEAACLEVEMEHGSNARDRDSDAIL